MSEATLYKNLKRLFWGISSAAILGILGAFLSAYISTQKLEANDARQDDQLKEMATKKEVEDAKQLCDDKIKASEATINDKLDLVLLIMGVPDPDKAVAKKRK